MSGIIIYVTWSTLFAALAGALAIGQILPYTFSSIRGTTKPSRIASGISLTSNSVTVLTMMAAGARAGLVLPIAFVFTGAITFALAIKFGQMVITKSDILNASIAAVALGAWVVLGPRVALVAMALANLTACLTVVYKLRRLPGSEDPLSWTMVFFATVLSISAILAEGSPDVAVLLVPTIGLISFGSVAGLTLVQQRVIKSVRRGAFTSTLQPNDLALVS